MKTHARALSLKPGRRGRAASRPRFPAPAAHRPAARRRPASRAPSAPHRAHPNPALPPLPPHPLPQPAQPQGHSPPTTAALPPDPQLATAAQALFPGRVSLYVPEVARRLRVTRQHVLHLIEEGLLEAFNVSSDPLARKSWRIPTDALLAFLHQRSSLS